jgi:hypothetical protein
VGESRDRLCSDNVFANRLASSEENIEIGPIAVRREIVGRYGAPIQMLVQIQRFKSANTYRLP